MNVVGSDKNDFTFIHDIGGAIDLVAAASIFDPENLWKIMGVND